MPNARWSGSLDGRAYHYSLVGDEQRAVATSPPTRCCGCSRATDRAGVLTRFVADLDPDDERFAPAALGRRPEAAAMTPSGPDQDRPARGRAYGRSCWELTLTGTAARPQAAARAIDAPLTGAGVDGRDHDGGLVLAVAALLGAHRAGSRPAAGRSADGLAPLRRRMGVAAAAGVVVVLLVAYLLARRVRGGRPSGCCVEPGAVRHSTRPPVLVLVEDEAPIAYAVAGRHGRIVVSTAMLAALSAGERRVLIAHESSHLRHRHHVYVQLAGLAPRPTRCCARRPTRSRSIERWADEVAATEVGNAASRPGPGPGGAGERGPSPVAPPRGWPWRPITSPSGLPYCWPHRPSASRGRCCSGWARASSVGWPRSPLPIGPITSCSWPSGCTSGTDFTLSRFLSEGGYTVGL